MSDTRPRLSALIDLVLVLGTAVIVKELMMSVAWKYAGPVSLLCATLLATWLLRRRGKRWADYGLRLRRGWKSGLLLLPQTVLMLTVMVGVSLAYQTWLAPFLPVAPGAEDRFADIANSPAFLMLWIGIAIIHGGFFEEMIYRGFTILKLTEWLGGRDGWRMPLAIVLQAAIFGARHMYYQGLGGALATGIMGAGFGLMFWMFRRNLWPLIIAHASTGTLSMTMRYLDSIDVIEPG
ncbi:type II CAAX endopeptidase family protein [Hyphobacterium sp. HN65]|uniref:Type II CAAX endopeptidase family protein n=1 Tax=Hyphobacterium lacteum TaxID=3116575 RepID=A0ABU7LTB2_9PROT|nr:type II CAAX endopeptidase family protein [Hyphobacterium sp. HN65]MEE2526589.1 type II CAAX endopeptidase family protein [Hyphobacterium sp. HN65]